MKSKPRVRQIWGQKCSQNAIRWFWELCRKHSLTLLPVSCFGQCLADWQIIKMSFKKLQRCSLLLWICKILGSQSDGYEELVFLGCIAMWSDESQPMFGGKRCRLLCLLPALYWFLSWFIVRPRRWRRHVLPKLLLNFKGIHGVMFQKREFYFIKFYVLLFQITWRVKEIRMDILLCLRVQTENLPSPPIQWWQVMNLPQHESDHSLPYNARTTMNGALPTLPYTPSWHDAYL
jgi:hypothetical protein